MRNITTGIRCAGCRLRPELCICALLPRIETRAHVAIVMHGLEQRKSTNTGALARRVLVNSEIIFFGNNLPALPECMWSKESVPVVLFPVAGGQPIAEFRGVLHLTLIALDANWRQAAKLRRRFAAKNIPFATAPVGAPGAYKLRSSPHEGGLSTYEAILRSLSVLENVPLADAMRAFRIFQDRLLWRRGSIDRGAVEGGIPDGVRRNVP
jgi:DTW domain-containing protein YfiP